MLLKVKETKQGDVLVLEIDGRLHGADSAEFQEKIMDMLKEKPPKMLFDLSGMTRVDSMGLRAFIMTSNKVKSYEGKMALCGLQRIVEDVFDISGFSSFFTICKTREEALNGLNGN
ncbi:MAG: STAS domain-containing protein [Kiritimatiellae bacterium]|nr:STAS domain-containing protein [Kiritimatiellia bacterium]MDD4734928.1 STAS domain-containing protein [Kiritimatiellia bacterium]